MDENEKINIVCLKSPSSVALKQIIPEGKHIETKETFQAQGKIYDFVIHTSNQYVLILSELGRIEIHK